MRSVQDLEQLSQMCKGKDWFYDISSDELGRVVVYVKFMNLEVLTTIPDMVGDKQIVVHFLSSLTANRDSFTNNLSSSTKPWSELKSKMPPEQQARVADAVKKELDIIEEALGPVSDEQSIRHLQDELDHLEKQCGSYTLQDIFYEIQDGKNAVTNMSARYPEVRKGLEKLFDQYGFDVIYEELDG